MTSKAKADPKAAAVLQLMNYSKHGPMAQLFIMDALLKAELPVVHGRGESNECVVKRLLKSHADTVTAITRHAEGVAQVGVDALVESFGEGHMLNPRIWFGVAVEIRDTLAQVS